MRMETTFPDPGDLFSRISHVTRLMQREGVLLPCPSPASRVANEIVGHRPDWMGRWGLLTDGRHFWLYCEPGRDTPEVTAGQILMHLPEGRYLIDTFDCESGACRARESAQGNPLVVGFAHHAKPVLLWIRRAGGNEEE
jgi:hypothetical protein